MTAHKLICYLMAALVLCGGLEATARPGALPRPVIVSVRSRQARTNWLAGVHTHTHTCEPGRLCTARSSGLLKARACSVVAPCAGQL